MDDGWSSLGRGYLVSLAKRPSWLAPQRGFEIMNQRDTADGRRRWVESLDGQIQSEQGARDINGVSFGTRLQRGWYWGSEAFREKRMTRVDSKALGANPNYRRSAMGQDRREKDGERIIAAAQRHYGVALDELRAKAYGGPPPRIGRVAAGPGNDVAAELDRRAARFEDAQP